MSTAVQQHQEAALLEAAATALVALKEEQARLNSELIEAVISGDAAAVAGAVAAGASVAATTGKLFGAAVHVCWSSCCCTYIPQMPWRHIIVKHLCGAFLLCLVTAAGVAGHCCMSQRRGVTSAAAVRWTSQVKCCVQMYCVRSMQLLPFMTLLHARK
jgi:hypothetical protein